MTQRIRLTSRTRQAGGVKESLGEFTDGLRAFQKLAEKFEPLVNTTKDRTLVGAFTAMQADLANVRSLMRKLS
jgi:hypothetical protein